MTKSMPDGNQSAEAVHACIEPENLSAWIDGEYELTPAEREHLKQCRKCSDLHKSYQIITEALRKALDVECPENLSGRLVLGVREKLASEKMESPASVHHYLAWATRIAAMLVLLGLIGYFAFKDGGIAGKRTVIPKEVTVLPNAGETELRPAPSVYNPRGIDITNTRYTAAGNSPVKFSDEALAQVEKVAKIEPQVRQIWIYDNRLSLSDVERTLRAQIEKLHIPLASVRMNVSPGSTELNAEFQISSYQTVMLARALKEAGYSLISPAQPQPEQTHFIGTGRELIQYSIVFSPKGSERN